MVSAFRVSAFTHQEEVVGNVRIWEKGGRNEGVLGEAGVSPDRHDSAEGKKGTVSLTHRDQGRSCGKTPEEGGCPWGGGKVVVLPGLNKMNRVGQSIRGGEKFSGS